MDMLHEAIAALMAVYTYIPSIIAIVEAVLKMVANFLAKK